MQGSNQLTQTFAALANPTRCAIVARLAEGEPDAKPARIPVSALAEPFDMSLPAAMKHVAILADAGLVLREKTGRTVHCSLIPGPMREAADWLERMEAFWNRRLDKLAAVLESEAARKTKPEGKS